MAGTHLPPWWPCPLDEALRDTIGLYQRLNSGMLGDMTFLEFKRICLRDAARSIRNRYDNRFRSEFFERIGYPNYKLKEWEEELIEYLMTHDVVD